MIHHGSSENRASLARVAARVQELLLSSAQGAPSGCSAEQDFVPTASAAEDGDAAVLHVRCPNCGQRASLNGEPRWSNIYCGACGYHFSLLPAQPGDDCHERERSLGHFELLAQIGSGTFGTVWRAQDTVLGRLVAIKMPRCEKLSNREVQQFLREARAAAQLQHPFIVRVHEVGCDAGNLYLVSDLIRGVSLATWLQHCAPTFDETAVLCLKIAQALEHAHAKKVIHRDLKPSNILLDEQGDPHLTDFGLAKRCESESAMTLAGQLIGTPEYMSPEQARGEGKHSDARSDIYSLGVVLYRLLTNQLPFQGSVERVLQQVIHDLPKRPRRLNHRIPVDLQTICLKCLEKDPDRRYQSADELASDLDRFLVGATIRSQPVSLGRRTGYFLCRHPWWSSVTAAVVLIVGLLAGANRHFTSRLIGLEEREVDARDMLAEMLGSSAVFPSIRNVENAHEQQLQFELDRLLDANPQPTQEQLLQIHAKWRDARWKLLYARAGRSAVRSDSLWADAAPLSLARFSAGGHQFVQVSHDGRVRVSQLQPRRQELGTWRLPYDELETVALSVDARRAAVCQPTATIIKDLITGRQLGELSQKGRVVAVAFSPECHLIATAGEDDQICLWDDQDYTRIPTRHVYEHPEVSALTFSPDGQTLVSGGGKKMWRWNVMKRTRIMVPFRVGHTFNIRAVLFSPDARSIVSYDDQQVAISDNPDRSIHATGRWKVAESATSVAVSADSRLLATSDHHRMVKIWDARTARHLMTLGPMLSPVLAVSFVDRGCSLNIACQNGTLANYSWNDPATVRGQGSENEVAVLD